MVRVRVATPGVCMMDRLRTGVYSDRSEFALLIGVLAACGGFVGFELFHVASDIVVFLSDTVAACSEPGSSTRFSNLLASYEFMS